MRFIAALEENADSSFKRFGFSRRKTSLTYTRELGESGQDITFFLHSNPSYYRGARAQVDPALQLKMPKLFPVARDLVQGDESIFPPMTPPHYILRQPLRFASPLESQIDWYVTGAMSFGDVCNSVVCFTEKWVLPLLSSLSSPTDVINAYESQDSRIAQSKDWWIFVMAAYRQRGQREEASQVLLSKFGTPERRARYAKLFETVDGGS